MHKELILKYKNLEEEYHELQEALILEDEEKQQLKRQNTELEEEN